MGSSLENAHELGGYYEYSVVPESRTFIMKINLIIQQLALQKKTKQTSGLRNASFLQGHMNYEVMP